MAMEMKWEAEGICLDVFGIVTGEVLQTMGVTEASGWAESLPDGAMKGAAMDQVAVVSSRGR